MDCGFFLEVGLSYTFEIPWVAKKFSLFRMRIRVPKLGIYTRSYALIGGFFIIQILMEYDELFTVNAK